MNRNCFRPWEIDVLLDIDGCNLRDSNRREILRRYQKAVQRELEKGSASLLKLSQYLNRNREKRAKSAATESQTARDAPNGVTAVSLGSRR